VSAPESLDAILRDAQTGTPDPRPAGPFADPEREARAQAWDEQVWTMAWALARSQGYDLDELPVGDPYFGQSEADDVIRFFTELAAAALKVIQAERAGEAEGEWEWGFTITRHMDGDIVNEEWCGEDRAEAERVLTASRDLYAAHGWTDNTWTLVRRIPAGQWEPAPAEGGA
jgi:hypothetical protein